MVLQDVLEEVQEKYTQTDLESTVCKYINPLKVTKYDVCDGSLVRSGNEESGEIPIPQKTKVAPSSKWFVGVKAPAESAALSLLRIRQKDDDSSVVPEIQNKMWCRLNRGKVAAVI